MSVKSPPPPRPAPLRLLSANIQAGSSTRAYREYVTRSWSHVLPNGKRMNLDALASEHRVAQLADAEALHAGRPAVVTVGAGAGPSIAATPQDPAA